MNGRVLVCCASRSRPDNLEQMIDSVKRTSTLADIAVYVDDDQGEMYQNVKGKYRIYCGERVWPCKALNRIVSATPGYEAYGAATDDCRFVTQGWDEWVLKTASGFKGGAGAIAPRTIGGDDRRMDFPWLTAKWVELAGSFVCINSKHFYWDVGLQTAGDLTQIAYATESEFALEHDSLCPTKNDLETVPGTDDTVTEHDIRQLNMFMDARETCGWIATGMKELVTKIRREMNS